MSILVYVAHHMGQAKPASWEVMGKARELADRLGEPLAALVAGHQVGDLAKEAVGYGADRVLLADDPALTAFRARGSTLALKAAIADAEPHIILVPNVSGARDAAALAACELGIGLAPDCQDLRLDGDDNLVVDRPVFSGNILTTVVFRARPQMATVRGRSFPIPARDSSRHGEITPLKVDLAGIDDWEEVLEFEPVQAGEVSLENAAIIISGGRGVKGPEGFAPLTDLAEVLGAAVGASRAAVDAGWIPYAHQVGQTGRTVRPDLYIACGISGAIQHMAGMSNAKVIVAINRDKDAPIFTIAQYGIVGDLFEIVPALTGKFKERLGR